MIPVSTPLDVTLNVAQVLGSAGAVTYVLGFLLVQTGHMCGNGMLYAVSKVVAAALVIISLIDSFQLPSFLIQISYLTIGLAGIGVRTGRHLRSRREPGRGHPPARSASVIPPRPRTPSWAGRSRSGSGRHRHYRPG